MKNNNPYLSGVADVWYSGSAGDLWVEYKFLVIPKRDTTVVNLVQGKDPMISRLQQQWLEARFMEDGFTTAELKSWIMPHHKLAALIEQRVHCQ